MTDKLQVVADALGEGRENAVTNHDLQVMTGCSRREVSEMVHSLRIGGEIICSGNEGYFKPATDQELIAGYMTLWRKAVSNLSALKAMRREVKRKGLLPPRKKRDESQTENT